MFSPDILGTSGNIFKAIGWAFLPFTALPCAYLFLYKNNFIQDISNAIITAIDSLSYAIGEAVKWLLPILVLTVAFTVFALSIFGQSWTKLFESAEYMHASIIMLGAAATLLAGQHVRVDIFHTRMSAKSRARVDFIGFYLALLPVCLIILWNSQSFVGFAWNVREASAESDGIAGVYWLKTLIPIFALVMIAQGQAIALRAAMCLCEQPLPARPKHIPKLFEDAQPSSYTDELER